MWTLRSIAVIPLLSLVLYFVFLLETVAQLVELALLCSPVRC